MMEDKQEQSVEKAGNGGGAADYWAAEREQEGWLEKAQKAAKAKKEKEESESES